MEWLSQFLLTHPNKTANKMSRLASDSSVQLSCLASVAVTVVVARRTDVGAAPSLSFLLLALFSAPSSKAGALSLSLPFLPPLFFPSLPPLFLLSSLFSLPAAAPHAALPPSHPLSQSLGLTGAALFFSKRKAKAQQHEWCNTKLASCNSHQKIST